MQRQKSLSHLSVSNLSAWTFWKQQILAPFLSYRRRLVAVFVSLILASAATALLILCLGPLMKLMFTMSPDASVALDDLLPSQLTKFIAIDSMLSIPMRWLVIYLPVAIMLAGCAKALAGYIYQVNQQYISLAVSMRLRIGLFERIILMSYSDLGKYDAGNLMSTLMNDISVIRSKLGDMISHVLRDALIVVTAIITMMTINWRGALILVLLAPVMAWSLGRGGGKIAKFAESWQQQLRELAGQVLDVRRRFDFMRSQGGENWETQRFGVVNDQYLSSIKKSLVIRSAYAPMVEWFGITIFAIFVIYYFGGSESSNSVEHSIQFLAALGLMVKPLKTIGEQFVNLAEAQGSLRQTMKLFCAAETDLKHAEDLDLNPAPINSFKICQLIAKHPGGPSTRLSDIEFKVGQMVGVVGPSGAGKSTLAKCFAGLIQPSVVEIEGIDWRELLNSVSYVSQTPFLFDQSLRENLSYASDSSSISDDSIWQALEMVEMAETIRQVGSGLDTQVAKFYANFSGGQLQRLTIARGLLRPNRRILVLDEATSGLDIQTETVVLGRLRQYVRETGRIIIMVSHRAGLFDIFDKIIFLESGEVKACGVHSILLSNSRYAAFCRTET